MAAKYAVILRRWKMKFENTQVYGFENAIIGMRLPMCKDYSEARSKSDSFTEQGSYKHIIGDNDLDLMKRLIRADENASGQPNSKFLRMIHCQVAITAPLYWWKEADTYKIATVTNSTSTMHKLANYPITVDCFEMDDFAEEIIDVRSATDITKSASINQIWKKLIDNLESLRLFYNQTKDKRYWKELIRLLPESWLQTRMFDCNYQTLRNIYHSRKNHKLEEWHTFCDWIKRLPYAEELITDEK